MKTSTPPQASPARPGPHPLVREAGEGRLPPWARASRKRRAHMEGVAELLGKWALARGEVGDEVLRWKAAGYFHDALRDGDPEELRKRLGPGARELPGKILHGPAVALRLREEGVADEELLHALALHTLGSPEFGALGMALFAADFLEPGRRLREEWRESLRRRAPGELEAVAQEILGARIGYLVETGRPLRPETVAFWNRMAEGEPWASASEL